MSDPATTVDPSTAGEIFGGAQLEDAETRKRRRALVDRLRGHQRLLERNSPTTAHVVSKAADALASCTCRPVAAWLFTYTPEQNRLERGLCRHRVCPHCERMAKGRLGFELTELITERLEAARQQTCKLAMLTLPFKHSLRDSLRAQRRFFTGWQQVLPGGAVKNHPGAWGKFYTTAFFKLWVKNYHRVIEVERSNGGWNLHGHVLIEFDYNLAEFREKFRTGVLVADPRYRWWARRERRQGRKPTEARFLSVTAAEIEQWFRETWRSVTRKLGRESWVLRYKEIRPGTEPGTALRRRRCRKSGRELVDQVPVAKVVQELIKYTTKGSAQGDGEGGAGYRGKLGLLHYTPRETVEYIRGIKSMHLHQSSRDWKRLQEAYEAEDLDVELAAAKDDGGRRVSFVSVVADLERGICGLLAPDRREEVLTDSLAFMHTWRGEAKTDRDLDRHNLLALETHLGRMLGAEDAPVPFNLTYPERVQVEAIKGREYRSGMREKAAEEITLETQADLEWKRCRGSPALTAFYNRGDP